MQIEYAEMSQDRQAVSFTMARPDDMHLHVRDGGAMADVVGHSARQFRRAIIMPNLKPPITSVEAAREYRNRIAAAYSSSDFTALMTLYLTDNTPVEEIRKAKESGLIHGVKLYPANATTNSAQGVSDIKGIYPVLEEMQKVGMPLLIHGEVTDPHVDIFDRERIFLDRSLRPLLQSFPDLKVVLEHITTLDAVEFVLNWNYLHATITAHHLLENRNAIFRGGIRPHYYCLPVLKREEHRQALLGAATSGNPQFFLGTDSAPHSKETKEAMCGCAGCFTGLHAIELYAQAFEAAGELERLEPFASHFGADFYGLPRNLGSITLIREEWEIPEMMPFGSSVVVPFRAGETLHWKMQ